MGKLLLMLGGVLISIFVNAQSDTLKVTERSPIQAYAKTRIAVDQFNQGLISDPLRLIQGRVPGLSMSRYDGDPNTPFDFVVRGFNSLQGNQQPLVVVDGIVALTLEAVDPLDIAEITVLKGPAATSFYGLQGGNGVILIETVQPESGKLNIRYHTQFERLTPNQTLEVLSPSEFINQGGFDHGSATDWFEEVTQSTWGMTQHLSMNAATSKGGYQGSVTYRNRPGILEGHGNSSINTGFGVHQLLFKDRIRVAVDIRNVVRDIDHKPTEVFRHAIAFNPTAPVFDPGSERFGGYFENPNNFDFFNPVAIRDLQTDEHQQNITQIHSTVELRLFEGLSLTSNLGQYRSRSNRNTYTSKFALFGSGESQSGIASRTTSETIRAVYESFLRYEKFFGGIKLAVKAGGALQTTETERFGVMVKNFQFDDFGFDNLNAAIDRRGTFTQYESFRGQEEIQSVYTIADVSTSLFHLSFNWRNDGYTGFGSNNKRGDYFGMNGSISLDRLLSVPEDISIQLFGSYGQAGNLPSSPYLSQALFAPLGFIDRPDGETIIYGVQDLENPDLGPERVSAIEIGTHFSAFKGKLNLDMSFYRQTHEDLLFEARVPVNPFIIRNQWLNLGEVKTNGFEYAIDYNFNLGGVQISSSLVGVFYGKRILEKLGNEEVVFPRLFPVAPFRETILLEVGEELGNFFGSVSSVDGDGQFVDRDFNNDGVIDLSDERIIGNALPKSQVGWNTTFSWKHWDLSLFFRGVYGHDILNTYRLHYGGRDLSSNTWNSIVVDGPRVEDVPQFNSYFIEKGNFTRLDNMTIGYQPNLAVKEIQSIRIYITLTNPLLFTDYQGVDPEVRYQRFGIPLLPGIEDRNTHFPTRGITFGFQSRF